MIRGLSLGKAMLVSDVGWFSELPDGVALKIPVDEYEVPTIAGALELAADHEDELGAAARAYVAREHDLEPRRRPLRAPRSRRRRAATRSPTRCSGGSPRPPPRSASTTSTELVRRVAREAGLV